MSNTQGSFGEEDNCRDELAIFGGQTRVLVSKLLTSKAPNWDAVRANWSNTPSGSLSRITKSEDGYAFDDKMDGVHPSLMDYMALFPPSTFSPGFTTDPGFTAHPPTLDQSIMSGVSAFPQFSARPELSNYAYPQYQQQSQPQEQQYQSAASLNTSSTQGSYPYDPSLASPFDTFRDSQTYSAASPTSASTPDTPASGDLTDLGMMMSGDSGMDEQWMSFMRESGILRSRSDTAEVSA
jgi:hypothetical protein